MAWGHFLSIGLLMSLGCEAFGFSPSIHYLASLNGHELKFREIQEQKPLVSEGMRLQGARMPMPAGRWKRSNLGLKMSGEEIDMSAFFAEVEKREEENAGGPAMDGPELRHTRILIRAPAPLQLRPSDSRIEHQFQRSEHLKFEQTAH